MIFICTITIIIINSRNKNNSIKYCITFNVIIVVIVIFNVIRVIIIIAIVAVFYIRTYLHTLAATLVRESTVYNCWLCRVVTCRMLLIMALC